MKTEQYFRLLLNAFELTAALAGFICWHKLKSTYWRAFPCLLIFIFITEIAAKILFLEGSHKHLIPLLYTYINIPATIVGYIWLMGKKLSTTVWALLPYWLTGLYFFVVLMEEIFLKKISPYSFSSLSYQAGCVCLLMMAFAVFLKIMRGDEILNFKSNLHFWVVLGIMIYMIPTLPFMAFRNTLFIHHEKLAMKLWQSTMLLNYMMYLCFIVGFVKYKPVKK